MKLPLMPLGAPARPGPKPYVYDRAVFDERLAKRFMSKVDTSNGKRGCWYWTAALDSSGYGSFSVGPRATRRNLGAHRVAWMMSRHRSTELHIDHLCGSTTCVNPSHLEAVTNEENQKRKDARYRRRADSDHAAFPFMFLSGDDLFGPDPDPEYTRYIADMAERLLDLPDASATADALWRKANPTREHNRPAPSARAPFGRSAL